jgi:hypothetical protein
LKKQAMLAGRELEPMKGAVKIAESPRRAREGEEDETLPAPPVDMPEAPRSSGRARRVVPEPAVPPSEPDDAAPEPPGEIE